jgi:TolB-like protein/DNA-binding winged helix-turn-helix (wHTH) protein/Flp pilus assembly protein TadD
MAAGAGFRFGPFVLNLDRGCLQKAGADLALRPKSFDVLRYLVERAGRLVSKDEVVSAVWPNVFVSDDALTQCVRDIRKVLNDDGEQFVRTVQRRGYMFVAETTPLAAADAPTPTSADGIGQNLKLKVRLGPVAPKAALAALAALVVGAVAAWALGWFERQPPPATETRLTIAVLPFATQGDDWLGDGIADDIMTAMSRFRDLTVIGRNSSFRYRGNGVDVRQVGKELKAHYVLMGSVRRSGDRLRISAQLVDTQTGGHRWAESYNRPFADVFGIQDEVANNVAGQFVVHAREAAAARLRTRAPEHLDAYELVLRGRKAYRTFTREGSIEARALAERAIAVDPTYAPAWELRAIALMQFYIHPYDRDQGTPGILEQAHTAAEKAVSLDPNFATAHSTLGFTHLWSRRHEASLASLRKAISLNPNDFAARNTYGEALFFTGSYRDALETWERYEQLDPFAVLLLAFKAKAHVMLGEFDRALPLARSCATRAPRLFGCLLYRAIAANELGLADEARAAVRQLLEVDRQFTVQRLKRAYPFRNEADASRFAEFMRRAGLPSE